MSLASLTADLKTTLHDSARVFESVDDGNFERFLLQALPDMQVKRPLTRLGEIALEVLQGRYAVLYADFAAYKTHLWADQSRTPPPWEASYPGAAPRVVATWDGAAWWLEFDPAPTYKHLAAWGRTFKFWYFAKHEIGTVADDTTIAPADRGLLLLRAQVEAMRELSIRNAAKPVQLRDGVSGTPRNSTAAAMYQALKQEFWELR